MNRKIIKNIISLTFFLVLVLGIIITSFNDEVEENNEIYIQGISSIDYSDFLSEQGEYYVYVYNPTCSDCLDVKEEISILSKQNKVYSLNLGHAVDRERVDWKEFHSHNDIEIGYMSQSGNKVYYEDESEEKYIQGVIKNSYGKIVKYDIIIADEAYMKENVNAKYRYIYASPQIPNIDYSAFRQGDKIVVPAVPMLFKIKGNKIDNYYYDVDEIKKHIKQLGIE